MSEVVTDERFQLRADATAELTDGRLVLAWESRRFAIRPVEPAMAAVIDALGEAPVGEEDLGALVVGGDDARRQVKPLLSRLFERGWLERTLYLEGRPLLTLRPIAAFAVDPPGDTEANVVMSRFAFLRRDGIEAVIESPRSPAVVVLHEPQVAALVAWLGRPRLPEDIAGSGVDLPEAVGRRVIESLWRAGVLVGVDEESDGDEQGAVEATEEEADQRFAQWSLPDLLFHSRSRFGRHANPYGGTWPLKGRFESPAAAKPFAGEPIALPRPDMAVVAEHDPSFTAVLEARRSVREHDDEAPLTIGQLGEFLYRAARVRSADDAFYDGTERALGSSRPYPTGGALYELEIYPLVRRCEGLEPGVYRYDPFEHRLGRLAGWNAEVNLLLEEGRRRSLMTAMPQLLIGVTARFGRVMYKYESMAYSTILKNVGVLYQTMYCVATAMGLAPCALGGGDAGRLADLVGLDYYDESSVGEFLLGSRPGPR